MAKKRGSRRGADKRDKREKRVRGRYVGHPRAFGFLLLEGGGADLFVPPGHEGDAIDGDTVLAERRGESAAKVTAVVARGRSRLCGTYIGRGAFLPDAHRIPKILSVEGKARKGDKVLVQKFKRRKNYRRIHGHRVHYTRLRVLSIGT